MAVRSFALPDLGEGLTEADILGWLVAEGDEVALNQPIVEVETAKAAVEVPSPWSGRVRHLHVGAGQTVAVGSPIIDIDTEGLVESAAAEKAGAPPASAHAPRPEAMLVGSGPKPAATRRRPRIVAQPGRVAHAPGASAAPSGDVGDVGDVTVLAKPPVRKLARDLGVDLRTVHGSGPAGSITRDDVCAAQPVKPQPGGALRGERVPVTGLRKAMAQAMTQSAFTAPHAAVFLTVDATETVRLRGALAATAEFAGVPLTPLTVIAKAACVAARRQPLINSQWDAATSEVVLLDQVNLGIAVATPRGLLVPNIKDAGSLSLVELAAALAQLTTTARDGHTRPPDLAGGTFSITNVGIFGVDGGIPILNPGESAILAVGTIRPTPWVHDGQLAVRDVVQLTLSFDHRVIDGQVAAQFLADVGRLISDPRLLLACA